jgi:molecular chaperone GrpE
MADDNKRQAEPEEGGPAPSAAETANGTEASAADDPAALAALIEDLRDKYLRAVAEADNIRKRAEREVAEARAYGIANFARDTIGVADNLARALDAIAPDARTNADDVLRALLDGVELTRRDMQNTLHKHGVRELDPKGEKFDPNFHQAMYEVPDSGAAAGTVVQVMQTGYAIGDRVLRPALVAVAKGGANAGTREPAAPPNGGEA